MIWNILLKEAFKIGCAAMAGWHLHSFQGGVAVLLALEVLTWKDE